MLAFLLFLSMRQNTNILCNVDTLDFLKILSWITIAYIRSPILSVFISRSSLPTTTVSSGINYIYSMFSFYWICPQKSLYFHLGSFAYTVTSVLPGSPNKFHQFSKKDLLDSRLVQMSLPCTMYTASPGHLSNSFFVNLFLPQTCKLLEARDCIKHLQSHTASATQNMLRILVE